LRERLYRERVHIERKCTEHGGAFRGVTESKCIERRLTKGEEE
jgi:hypothetical protein